MAIVVIDLPAFILHIFLQNWCKSVDLVRLDSALCVHLLREKFLGTIRSDRFVLQYRSPLWPHHEALLFKWLLSRAVPVCYLWVEGWSAQYADNKNTLSKVTKSVDNLTFELLYRDNQLAVRNILQVTPLVRELCVCNCDFDDEIYRLFPPSCSNVKNLILHGVSVSYESAQIVLQGLKQLTLLKLSYGVFTNAAMLHIAFCCPHLRALSYTEEIYGESPPASVYLNTSLSSETLTAICTMCTQLRVLSLYYHSRTLELSIVYHTIAQRLLHLRTLDIGGATITNSSGLNLIFNKLHTLRHVEINASELNNEAFLRLLYQNPELRRVSLDNGNDVISGVNTEQIPLQLNCLRYLMLEKFTALTDEGVYTVLQACPLLNNLTITGAPLITPEKVVSHIVKLCVHLIHGYFNDCIQFTEEKVERTLTKLGSGVHIGVNDRYEGYEYDDHDEMQNIDNYVGDSD